MAEKNEAYEAEQQTILAQEWKEFLQDIEPRLIQWRRDFHQYPEVGWTEYRTTYRIAERLAELGYEVFAGRQALASEARMGVPMKEVLNHAEHRAREQGVPSEWLERMKDGHTGLVACLDTGRPGPHIAFRFDIDALPIKESEEEAHAPYVHKFRSLHHGSMHACGHDGHTAIGLGLAHWLVQFQERLKGKYTLLFQPAEEGSRGAKAMVAKGWLDDVDYFLTGHIGVISENVGHVASRTAGFLATTKMNVIYKGRSAHAGFEPQKGKNALLAACSAALQLQAIPHHSDGATRLNVGTLHAGQGRNIVPDQANMELETRGETTALNQYMDDETRRILKAVAQLYDVEMDLEVVGEGIGAFCDPEWDQIVREACADSLYVTHMLSEAKIGGSEDATYMMKRVQEQGGKATYMIFASPLTAGHHHPSFDFQERVLTVAVETYARCVVHVLEKGA